MINQLLGIFIGPVGEIRQPGQIAVTAQVQAPGNPGHRPPFPLSLPRSNLKSQICSSLTFTNLDLVGLTWICLDSPRGQIAHRQTWVIGHWLFFGPWPFGLGHFSTHLLGLTFGRRHSKFLNCQRTLPLSRTHPNVFIRPPPQVAVREHSGSVLSRSSTFFVAPFHAPESGTKPTRLSPTLCKLCTVCENSKTHPKVRKTRLPPIVSRVPPSGVVRLSSSSPINIPVFREIRQELLAQVSGSAGPRHTGEEIRQSAQAKAEGIVREEMSRLNWTDENLRRRPKGDPRKVTIAARLRREP
ncbi:MAG: hypothetical protein JWR69_3494 [Pedosphaera sp.]|nr:hypothetical protein [Pedosphaera sp.]